jgi:hypothetical protein
MKTLAGLLMIANAAIFFFGGVQHAGITIGRFHEPLIIPPAIVEAVCGLCLLWGAIALLRHSRARWRVALVTNLVALGYTFITIFITVHQNWSTHIPGEVLPAENKF